MFVVVRRCKRWTINCETLIIWFVIVCQTEMADRITDIVRGNGYPTIVNDLPELPACF